MDNADFFPPGGVPFLSYTSQDQHPLGFIPHPHAIQQQEGSSRRTNMSTNPARHPKARKRLNPLNRERTVTTLTNNGHFPTASEQPAGSFFTPVPYAAENMSSMAMMNTQGYDMPGPYGYGFETPVAPMYHPNMNNNHSQPTLNSQQQQPPAFSRRSQRLQHGAPRHSLHQSGSSHDSTSNPKDKPALPDGKDDLEILQNLKKLILDNQHPFYKAIPKPEYLAQLYKGQIPTDTQAKELISNGKTSASEPHLKEEPSSAGIGGVSAAEAEVKTLGGLERGSATEQHLEKNVDPQAPTQAPIAEVTGHEHSANVAQQQTSEGPAVSVLSSIRPKTQSLAPVTTPNVSAVTPTKQRASPSSADVKPAVHPSEGTASAQDPMQVDTPPPSAALGVPTVNQSPPKRLYDKGVPQAGSPVSVSVVPFQPQGPQSVRDIQATDSRRLFQVPGTPSLSIPVEETVPFDGNRLANRPVPFVSTVAPPVATEIVPFGGTSSIIPGLGPVVSTSGFTPVLASAPSSVQLKPVVDIRSSPAPVVMPSSAPAVRPPNLPTPNGPPPAPVNVPAAEQAARPSLKERLEQPPVHQQSRPARQPSSESQSHPHDRNVSNTNANNNNMKGRNKKNQHPPYTGPPKGGDRSYNRPPGPPDGPPPPSASAPLRTPFRGRSPPLDNRKLPISPAPRGPPPRDYRGPPAGRSPSRERGGYSRPPPHDFVEPRRDSLDMDGPPPGRYDGRLSYPDYPPAPLPLSGGRGPPPDGGRGEYYGSYAPAQDRGPRWEDPYYKRDWERGPPPGSADRGRFDRDYEPTGSWDRADREFGDRDPVYPEDDRYTPREPERARPPAPFTPAYGRVRGRSPSPIGRPGPGDSSRPPVKRAREDFGPEYYPGPGPGGAGAGRPPVRRGPPGDYAPPPRSGGGPGGADWNTAGGPPPPASASSMGGGIHGGRDYLGRGDASMEYSPLPDNYDRARSPPPPASGGRASYGVGGGGGRSAYNRGPERYGGLRPPP
ncbi:hypothetical protein D9619_011508 [Psilocybe cf. subviscida]|uniref:Uncharacterized protein n=1 Tax=Psilocybe cf. subviscida TaxID=2480587 RepID=A0A8H5F9L9_9AGAR|nr:hypothetical protein D9619_011508 [Psilocybe cf. subviscida]